MRSVWQKTHRASILFGCANLSGFDTCESGIFLVNTLVLNIRRSMTYEDKLHSKILIFVLRVFLNATSPVWNILFDNDFKVTVLWISSSELQHFSFSFSDTKILSYNYSLLFKTVRIRLIFTASHLPTLANNPTALQYPSLYFQDNRRSFRLGSEIDPPSILPYGREFQVQATENNLGNCESWFNFGRFSRRTSTLGGRPPPPRHTVPPSLVAVALDLQGTAYPAVISSGTQAHLKQ